jgi:hypothetical protein
MNTKTKFLSFIVVTLVILTISLNLLHKSKNIPKPTVHVAIVAEGVHDWTHALFLQNSNCPNHINIHFHAFIDGDAVICFIKKSLERCGSSVKFTFQESTLLTYHDLAPNIKNLISYHPYAHAAAKKLVLPLYFADQSIDVFISIDLDFYFVQSMDDLLMLANTVHQFDEGHMMGITHEQGNYYIDFHARKQYPRFGLNTGLILFDQKKIRHHVQKYAKELDTALIQMNFTAENADQEIFMKMTENNPTWVYILPCSFNQQNWGYNSEKKHIGELDCNRACIYMIHFNSIRNDLRGDIINNVAKHNKQHCHSMDDKYKWTVPYKTYKFPFTKYDECFNRGVWD